MYNAQYKCTMCNVQLTMYNVQRTVYNIQCAMYNVQWTMFRNSCHEFSPQILTVGSQNSPIKNSWKFKFCAIRDFVWHCYHVNCACTRVLSFVLRRVVTHSIPNVMKQIGFCYYFVCSCNKFLKICVTRICVALCSVHRIIVLWVTECFWTSGCLFLHELFIHQSEAPEL